MLIRFEVQNFLSFREKISFSTLPGEFPVLPSHLASPIEGFKFLKGSAIYGTNGAGKSNFVSAVLFLDNLIRIGTPDYRTIIPLKQFKLDEKSINQPTNFVIEFVNERTLYRYEIEIYQNIIKHESLSKLKKNSEYEIIFERSTTEKGKTSLKFSPNLFEPKDIELARRVYQKELRDNQPFFYEGANKKINEIFQPHSWFYDTLSIVTPESYPSKLLEHILKDPIQTDRSNNLLRTANTGVHQLKFERVPIEAATGYLSVEEKKALIEELTLIGSRSIRKNDGSIFEVFLDENTGEPIAGRLMAQHICENGKMVDFEIYEESDGTRRFIDVLPALLLSTQKDKVFLIDEIERSMHPLLVKNLVEFFYESQTDKSRGQLIFTTHEVVLLNDSLFRPDEIWLFNKSKSGASELYSISDFKAKYGDNMMEAYLRGDFGAIPFLNNSATLED